MQIFMSFIEVRLFYFYLLFFCTADAWFLFLQVHLADVLLVEELVLVAWRGYLLLMQTLTGISCRLLSEKGSD